MVKPSSLSVPLLAFHIRRTRLLFSPVRCQKRLGTRMVSSEIIGFMMKISMVIDVLGLFVWHKLLYLSKKKCSPEFNIAKILFYYYFKLLKEKEKKRKKNGQKERDVFFVNFLTSISVKLGSQ